MLSHRRQSHISGRQLARIHARLFPDAELLDIAEAMILEEVAHSFPRPNTPRPALPVRPSHSEYRAAQNPPLEIARAHTLPSGEKLSEKSKYYWFGVASVELNTPSGAT